MEKYFGENVPKLGFGLMRLPRIDEKTPDVEQTKKMVDKFMDAGLTYFDTAFVYGDSEEVTKKALVDRYPRDKYTLCTKLCAWMGCTDAESAKQEFFTSLERTGAGYFDYYLLHALQSNNYTKYDEYKIWDFVKEQQAKGLIKYWGFSFHADHKLLDKLLTEHPEVDFVQLQLNYADWDDPIVQSRLNYEVARKHGKSIVVMEPVKGGALADPPEAVKELFKSAAPEASYASWAIRYIASLDGILTVLSGMSTIEQMDDNVSYMKNFVPMNEKELETIKKAQEIIKNIDSIPCTACHYCTDGCPQNIPIPEIFAARNRQTVWKQIDGGKWNYSQATKDKGKASDCIECGQCENACPQQINVIDRLKDCAAAFDN